MTENKKFAFDGDTVEGCECPAVAAGYEPMNDESLTVASLYDSAVYQLDFDSPNRIISEEQAKKAWFEAMETVKEGYKERHFEIAQEIAEELGWDE